MKASDRYHMPVQVRGVLYPSATDAAAALGVTPAAVYQAIRRGATDTLGRGKGNYTTKRTQPPRPPKPVMLADGPQPSLRQASLHLGRHFQFASNLFARYGEDRAREILLTMKKETLS